RALDRPAVEAKRAGHRRQESGDRLKQRRLAAAGRAEKHITVAGIDLEPDLPGGGNEAVLGLILQRHPVRDEKRPYFTAVCRRIGHNFSLRIGGTGSGQGFGSLFATLTVGVSWAQGNGRDMFGRKGKSAAPATVAAPASPLQEAMHQAGVGAA